MEELEAYRRELLSTLEGVIPVLSKTIAAIPPNVWLPPYEHAAHAPHYTLSHLCVLEIHVFYPLLQGIVSKKAHLLPLFDDNAWMANHYDPDTPVPVILEEFTGQRLQEVSWLSSLSSENWSATARHPWWGEHTLQWWVELQLEYSHQHLIQLAAFLTV